MLLLLVLWLNVYRTRELEYFEVDTVDILTLMCSSVPAMVSRHQNTIKCKPIKLVISQLRQFVHKRFKFFVVIKGKFN